MKVELEIDKKYTEPEIHVCNRICDEETVQLKQAVCEFVDGNVVAYDGDSSVLLRYADIVRIFSANKNVYVSTEEGQYRIRERLYEMEERLDLSAATNILTRQCPGRSQKTRQKEIDWRRCSIIFPMQLWLALLFWSLICRRLQIGFPSR